MTSNTKLFGLITAILLVLPSAVKAQEDTTLGAFLAYGTEIENIGIGANAEFPIMESLTISPSFIYYLPKSEGPVDINWFEVNANANYYLLQESSMSIYAIGGLNYSSVETSIDDDAFGGFGNDISGSDGRFGLNLGGGANFDIGSGITPFAELKYVIIDGGQLVLGAGVRFKI